MTEAGASSISPAIAERGLRKAYGDTVVATVLRTVLSTILVVLGVAALLGFRPAAGPLGWLAIAGLTTPAAFALIWVAVAVGLTSRNPDSGNHAVVAVAWCLAIAVAGYGRARSALRRAALR